MAKAATTPALDLAQVSELLETAHSILQRNPDRDLAIKTFATQGYLELSKTHPNQNRDAFNKALVDLRDAVYLHLNAELEAVAALFKPSPR